MLNVRTLRHEIANSRIADVRRVADSRESTRGKRETGQPLGTGGKHGKQW